MRRGEENQVAGSKHGYIRLGKRQVIVATQIRVHVRYRHARFRPGGNTADRNFRVNREDSQQFHTGVAGATNDAYFNHHLLQRRRIRINSFDVVVYHDKPMTYCSPQGDRYNVVRILLTVHLNPPELWPHAENLAPDYRASDSRFPAPIVRC